MNKPCEFSQFFKLIFLSFTFFLLSITNSLGQQTVNISPVGSLDFSTDCLSVVLGEMVTFNRNIDCGQNMEIWKINGASQSLVFSSDKPSSSYTFEEEGQYVINCNGTSSGSSGFAGRRPGANAMCINVAVAQLLPSAVPSMGEWSLICCGLWLMIFGVTGIKQYAIEPITG